MKKVFLSCAVVALMASCGGNKSENATPQTDELTEVVTDQTEAEAVEETTSTDQAESAETSEPTEVASASNTWDETLDEYEAYCTKLASLSKKAQSGDFSAITEYGSLLEKAESLQNKLENAESEMTTAQVARLNKIVAKMASSMM